MVFVWSKVGIGLVVWLTRREFGLSKWWLANAFGSQRRNCIFSEPSPGSEVWPACVGLGAAGSYWGTTAPAQMTDSSGGPRLTRERQGSGVTGGWTHWHLRGPTKILESSSTSFKSERGATYLTFLFTFAFSFPLALFRGFGPVFEKVLLRYQYIEETF